MPLNLAPAEPGGGTGPIAEDFVVPHDPLTEGETSYWGCMDDRWMVLGALYRQVGGGPIGHAQDALVASEIYAPGTHLDISNHRYATERSSTARPLHVATADVTQNLRGHGIEALLHASCAGELLAPNIAATIADRDRSAEVLATAQSILPYVTGDTLDWTQDIYQAMIDQGVYGDPAEAATAMELGVSWNGWHFDPITRKPLDGGEHIAGSVLANHHSRTAFDTQGAVIAGVPAYHVSMGDIPELCHPLSEMTGMNYNQLLTSLRVASAIRHAGIILNLPRLEPDEPLEVRTVGLPA